MAVAAIAVVACTPAASAQSPEVRGTSAPTLAGAMELETAGSYRQAASAYRAVLGGVDMPSALLGLERVYAALGWTDSLLPVVDSLIDERPTEPLLLFVRLRALIMSGQEQKAEARFEQWAGQDMANPQPYRDYARLLLDAGRMMAADSVLERAQRALGSGRDVAMELAQLRARTGLWGLSAVSWREAMATSPYLVQAAVFALQPTPSGARDSVRAAFLYGPPDVSSRLALARLELAWGDAGAGWRALAPLTPTDSTVEGWTAFAGEAEAVGAANVAADALAAAVAARPSPQLRVRAADAALRAGRAAAALAIVQSGSGKMAEADDAASQLLLLRVRALSVLGRAVDAERLVNSAAAARPELAMMLQRELAWAWVRSGELDRARDALALAGADSNDEVHGWLALYAGDFRGARERLRATDDAPDYIITALALLGRTVADSAPVAGQGFLALARGDSAAAVRDFVRAADLLPDAAPLLLATAGRLAAATGDDASAVSAWERVTSQFEASPEAAEADLGWARLLRRRGDNAEAAARLEHLILSYPESALLPQARRELELMTAGDNARGRPPSSDSPRSGSPPR